MGELLDAAAVRRWCRLAADTLGRDRAKIDLLNVFPVPDRDTGTNLHLTVLAAAEAADRLPGDADAATAWQALADGALLGARGNSGMILSQILLAMADVLGRGGELGEALRHASRQAYQAVSHPVEGTMLTVLRVAATAGPDGGEPAVVARTAVQHAHMALQETTGQLDVLARHGVVDAGAAGLCVVLETLAVVICDEAPYAYDVPRDDGPAPESATPRGHSPDDHTGGGYEVMYLLDAPESAVSQLRAELDRIGDSLIVIGEDGLLNVHVHTEDAGAAIEVGIRVGRPYHIRVTYLDQQ